jgi:hypothetical protein
VPPGVQSKQPETIRTIFVEQASATLTLRCAIAVGSEVVTGILAVRRESDGALPLAMLLSPSGDIDYPTQVSLNYPTASPTIDFYSSEPYDTALRSQWGGFLPPLAIETAEPPPSDFNYSVTATAINDVTVTIDAPATSCTLAPVSSMNVAGIGNASAMVRLSETSFMVTFPGAVSVGDTFTWTQQPDGPRTNQGRVAPVAPVICT